MPQSNTSQVILKAHNLNVNNINISDNSKLKSGGRDIFIKGDFTCNGEYEAEKNTVYFNGNTEQTIKGNKDINFFNLTKNKGVSRVNLNTNINVNGNFTLETGVFNTIVNNLYIKGNGSSMFDNNDTEIWFSVSVVKNYEIGDIVLYHRGYDLLLHRIVCKNKKFYLIKGDNENYMEEIHEKFIIARVNNRLDGMISFNPTKTDCVTHIYNHIKFVYYLHLNYLYDMEVENE